VTADTKHSSVGLAPEIAPCVPSAPTKACRRCERTKIDRYRRRSNGTRAPVPIIDATVLRWPNGYCPLRIPLTGASR
jgi:hypothetical protein